MTDAGAPSPQEELARQCYTHGQVRPCSECAAEASPFPPQEESLAQLTFSGKRRMGRIRMLWHLLRGRPLVYRCSFASILHLTDTGERLLIKDCHFDVLPAVRIEVPRD